MTAPHTMSRYKTLLLEARQLRDDSGKMAYRVATILVEVYNDAEFRHDHGVMSDDKIRAELSTYTNFGDFDRLEAMLKFYPNESQWVGMSFGSLERRMREEMHSQFVRKQKQRDEERRRDAEAKAIKERAEQNGAQVVAEKVRDPRTGHIIYPPARVAPPTKSVELANANDGLTKDNVTLATKLVEVERTRDELDRLLKKAEQRIAVLEEENRSLKNQLAKAKRAAGRLESAFA